jgi:hypothetical protein
VKSPKKTTQTSPISDRVRERLAEMGMSETHASERMGWTRTVLSTLLRRIDEGGALRDETVDKLELVLGKPGQWIRTGEEPPGVRLADCPGWAEAARIAAERWGLTPAQIALVGDGRMPQAVRFVDPSLIRSLSDAL